MSQRVSLILLAAGAATLTALLSLTCARAAQELTATAPAWWGPSHLAGAVVALTCGLGALGALWHTVSALLALVVLRGTSPGAVPRGAARGASLLLGRWGAPLVRRAAAGALAASIAVAPAYATEASPSTDDLGWRPTSSVQQAHPTSPSESAEPAESSEPTEPAEYAEPPGAPSPTREGAAGTESLTHTVAPGESLWSITAQHLPTGTSTTAVADVWPVLYDTNHEVIGDDPTALRPGTVLTIPHGLGLAADQEAP